MVEVEATVLVGGRLAHVGGASRVEHRRLHVGIALGGIEVTELRVVGLHVAGRRLQGDLGVGPLLDRTRRAGQVQVAVDHALSHLLGRRVFMLREIRQVVGIGGAGRQGRGHGQEAEVLLDRKHGQFLFSSEGNESVVRHRPRAQERRPSRKPASRPTAVVMATVCQGLAPI